MNDLTELVFIIDKSGSMWHLADSTIAGFNDVIESQRKTPGEKIVSIILFNHNSEVLCDRKAISDICSLTENDYNPHGNTALLDALQVTMNDIANRHRALEKENLPENTIFFITTDGKENASRGATEESVRRTIEYHKENDGWQFVFLAANLDAVSTAARYGIDSRHSVRYHNDARGTALKFKAMNRYIENVVYNADENDWANELKEDYSLRAK